MNYAHMLLDSDDNILTVFLQQCVSIEKQQVVTISVCIFLKHLKILWQERAYTYHPINNSDESQEISSDDNIILF